MMPEQHARENFEFFKAQRAKRLDALRQLMGTFDIVVGYDEDTKVALDRWLAKYGALLSVSETGSSFLTHQPEWTGQRLGLNVIFDFAIFIGEFAARDAVARMEDGHEQRSRTHPYRPLVPAPDTSVHPHDAPFSRDIIYETHDICGSLSDDSYLWKSRMRIREIELRERHFVTKTLRLIFLHARGEFEVANKELTTSP